MVGARNNELPSFDWRTSGACLDADPELFFPPDGMRGPERRARENEAVAICRTCRVLDDCLGWALATHQPYGVWGGMTEDDRLGLQVRKIASPLND